VGSGVVARKGLVLTAAHAVRGEEVTVTFADGRRADARLKAADLDSDLAVLEVDTGDIEPVEWAPEDADTALGAAVLALGNPGGRGLRVTLGHVSADQRSFRGPRGRRIGGALEHSAPLPRGSSGGPLVDPEGRLLGLNAVRREGGLILALPVSGALRERAEALLRGETPARPRLGVAVAPPRAARKMRAAVGLPERAGLLVRAVESGSPADRAGIERGDLLASAGGRELDSVDSLHEALEAAEDKLALTIVRGTDERELEVPLGEAA
jgi:serine protease Do